MTSRPERPPGVRGLAARGAVRKARLAGTLALQSRSWDKAVAWGRHDDRDQSPAPA
jgi:hypothetical protein